MSRIRYVRSEVTVEEMVKISEEWKRIKGEPGVEISMAKFVWDMGLSIGSVMGSLEGYNVGLE